MKQHQLLGISKLASFLLPLASGAAPSVASGGDSRVLVLLLGLTRSGDASRGISMFGV